MRSKIAVVWIVSILLACYSCVAAERIPGPLESLARTALHGNPAESAEATASLRQAGPAGMEAALALAGSPKDTEALDRVCGVRDCADIRLFWYTDLEAAKAAAKASGKPILSLRLLGRLDEEFSCANSRFFRTVFYKNRDINALLRDRFILHWHSLRPVPRVTIDFGDGSRLERTLTGNSIHYVLDSRGRLVQPLPGLYGPAAFQKALEEAARAVRTANRLDDIGFEQWQTLRIEEQLRAVGAPFRLNLRALPTPPDDGAPGAVLSWSELLKNNPDLRSAAMSKQAVEAPILSAFDLTANDDQLNDIARLRRPRVHLDPASRDFLLLKQGIKTPDEAARVLAAFEATVALDEVINEYRTGPAILRKLMAPETRKDFELEEFNQWVYAEVFRAPLSDPWLGLAPGDLYGALPAATRTAGPGPRR